MCILDLEVYMLIFILDYNNLLASVAKLRIVYLSKLYCLEVLMDDLQAVVGF